MSWSATGDALRTLGFGIAARRAIADYLKHLALAMFVILLVAWTIDLAATFPEIRKDAETTGQAVYRILLPYLGYRSADIILRILPMACFIGVFLAEFRRRLRLETVICATAGSGPARLIGPVVIFGALLGGVQFQLESHWRPAAIAAQVELGHGQYAERFEKRKLSGHRWFVDGDRALRGVVFRQDQPELRDVSIFEGLRSATLTRVIEAEIARPGEAPGKWMLQNARIWDIEGGSTSYTDPEDMLIALNLIPEQLRYYGVPGMYLPEEPLRAIAQMTSAAAPAADAEVAIWQRKTAWFIPGVVALMAVLLARQGFSGRQPKYARLIALGLLGNTLVISIKVLWAVGSLDGLSGPAATGLPIVVILVLCGWLVRREILGAKPKRWFV